MLESANGATILYRDDEASWAGLWGEVSELTGVEFVVESRMVDVPRYFVRGGEVGEAWLEDPKRLGFEVRRVWGWGG